MYTVVYRRKYWPLKQTVKDVLGHSYHEKTDKMFIETASGGREIMCWSSCEIHLGSDWKAHIKELERIHIEGK